MGWKPEGIEYRDLPGFTAESPIPRLATPLHADPALLLCELGQRAVNAKDLSTSSEASMGTNPLLNENAELAQTTMGFRWPDLLVEHSHRATASPA